MNGHRTIFKTFGCNFLIAKLGEGNYVANSYVHLGFADPEQCWNKDDYFRIFGRLASALHKCADFAEEEPYRFDVNFKIETLRFAGEVKGTVAAIDCDVSGTSEGDAKERWIKLMSAIADHLSNEALEESDGYSDTYALTITKSGHPETESVLRLVRTAPIKTWEAPTEGDESFWLTRQSEGWQLEKGSRWISQMVATGSFPGTFILKDQDDPEGASLECVVS